MVLELKTYINMSKVVDKQQFLITAEEWDRSQPEKKHIFKQQGGYNGRKTYHQADDNRQGQQDSSGSGSRRSIICFHCGKPGHVSRECWARLGADAHKPTPVATPQADAKPVICFSCHEVGHKSPQCPKKQKGTVKRIQIPVDSAKALEKNEVMTDVSGTLISVTVDSGARMTVVPLEVVKDMNLLGRQPPLMV